MKYFLTEDNDCIYYKPDFGMDKWSSDAKTPNQVILGMHLQGYINIPTLFYNLRTCRQLIILAKNKAIRSYASIQPENIIIKNQYI